METIREAVRESINHQEELLQKIRTAHESAFGKSKTPIEMSVVGKLTLAGESYEQLLQDLDQGMTFYADLTGILLKFQNKVC